MSIPVIKNNRSLAALLLFLVLFAISCEPPVTFSEPQPTGKPDLESFPVRLRGIYLSSDSSYEMTINEKVIVRNESYADTMFQSRLDSIYILNSDTLVNKPTGLKFPVSISGDSIFCRLSIRDTLFSLSDENLVRKWKGYCFINMCREDAGWEVKKISLQRGMLDLSSVGRAEDIGMLNELSENPSDTIPPGGYKISRKEFRQFIRGGGFEGSERFVRLGKGYN